MNDMTITMVLVCVLFAMACLVCIGVIQERVLQQAAQTECARFNPETGDFEWLDKQGE